MRPDDLDHLDRIHGLITAAPGSWSVHAVDVADPAAVLVDHHADRELRTASSAKVLALVATAVGLSSGVLDPDEPLDRRSVTPVADSGLWQHLRQDVLCLDDVARLVGVVSDNWATNVLVGRLGGVAEVARTAAEAGYDQVHLHDIVRRPRDPERHPPTLSTGSAHGYAAVFARLWSSRTDPDGVADRVLEWLRDGTDLSMVAGAFGLDPLAHTEPDRGAAVWSKTGTDTGVRADSGVVAVHGRAVAYSCLVNWPVESEADPDRDEVLGVMRAVGVALRRSLERP